MTLKDAENAILDLRSLVEMLNDDLTEAYERIDQLRDHALGEREAARLRPKTWHVKSGRA